MDFIRRGEDERLHGRFLYSRLRGVPLVCRLDILDSLSEGLLGSPVPTTFLPEHAGTGLCFVFINILSDIINVNPLHIKKITVDILQLATYIPYAERRSA